jgi:cytochrome c
MSRALVRTRLGETKELALQRANRRTEDARMKNSKTLVVLAVAFLIVALSSVAVGQDKATAQEVVAKVREAASTLSKTGDVAQFNQKQGPWVWKDTYIFVNDCDKKVVVANPIKPEQTGQDIGSLKGTRGKNIYPDPQGLCDAAKKPSGTWVEYWWPKPGAKEDSRKISYYLSAKGTPYIVGAGVYDDKATIAELSKLSSTK